ncbi:bifunctional diguanylate cyclase/phosphodiesterase [Neobacillus kokaensis]|uniref:GGDEF domain-containing protein n=1 Tax=Neobacillus kokaensis TaxID=2759023 RepID=A0ABQ3N3I9_9BACI|nr:bifunctional diguanylate cyclase/phosphodiesterase [Neobacillus kokaensis]GHH99488.1 GGDEF domain-containing protein [Neobacillus kokaensis]
MKELLLELEHDFDSILDLIDSFSDIFCLKDGEGNYVYVGGKFFKLLNIENSCLIGKRNIDLAYHYPFLQELFEQSEVTDEQTWLSGSFSRYQDYIYHIHNQTVIYDVMKLPFYYKDGRRKGLLILGKDITVGREKKRELDTTLKELNDIKQAMDKSVIVAITDNKGFITYVNEKFCELSKYVREELLGQNHSLLNSGYHSKAFFKEMWRTIGNGKVWTGEIKNRAKDGSYYWVKTNIVPFLNENGDPYQYISIRQDITDQKETEEKIRYNALHDELTGLRNRRCFHTDVDCWIQENKQKQMALLFLDLDRFKYINDHFGHRMGDRVLQAVTKRITKHLGESGDVYRFGGDEFIIILRDCAREKAKRLANEISGLFGAAFHIRNERIYVSTSIGVSFYPDDGENLECLVKKADSAMFSGKKNRTNEVQYYSFEIYEQLSKRVEMERDLRDAIKEKSFSLHYQPQIDLASQKIVGVEALIRWQHHAWGNIPPSEFIPLAEETGLITPITEWVLKTAFHDLQSWVKNGIKPIRMAVNISAILFHEDLVSFLKRILDETNMNPAYVELEITESVMQNPRMTIPILKQLRSLGVRLSIDDFGTGYSSLACLRDLPIDCLKIDRSFIEDIERDQGIIVKTIIDMASHLNVDVIAEGIEKQQQLQFLSTLSCKEGQGYLFSRPLPSKEISTFLFKPLISSPV